MRWMAWNLLGCLFWFAGLASAKGTNLIGPVASGDSHQILIASSFGLVGAALLTWVNLLDAS